MTGALLALLANVAYNVGFVIFKAIAGSMPPLRGTRPFHVAKVLLTNPVWLFGLAIVLSGVAMQTYALRVLPLSVAQPILASSLPVLLLLAVVVLGERLTGREWTAMALIGVSMLLVALSAVAPGQRAGTEVDFVGLFVVAIPSGIAAILIFQMGDLSAAGRHARPLAGVAYGLGIGIGFGVAQLGIKGLSVLSSRPDFTWPAALASPYPYVVVGAAGVALGGLQIACQRCRVSIVVPVNAVAAHSYLVLMGTFVYDESWPADPVLSGLRILGFLMVLLALALFPRIEPGAEPEREWVAFSPSRPIAAPAHPPGPGCPCHENAADHPYPH